MRDSTAGRQMWMGAALALTLVAVAPRVLDAQVELADFDYENLQFRGFALEWGYLTSSTRVEPVQTFGVRADLGYLGPGLRIAPSVTYWSSEFYADEVVRLERRLEDLIAQTGGTRPDLRLGRIEWSDIVVSVDAHVVWSIPWNILTYAGIGGGLHIMNGSGNAIAGTFVEDFLDSVSPGGNLHVGLEYPITDVFRLYGQGRAEVLGDLQYTAIRFGGQYTFGDLVAGEERGR